MISQPASQHHSHSLIRLTAKQQWPWNLSTSLFLKKLITYLFHFSFHFKLTEIMTSQNGDFRFFAKKPSLWRHPGQRESRIHFRFSVSGRAWPILLELLARFGWKLPLPVWWATENCEKTFRWSLLAVLFARLACHTGCPRPPASLRLAGGGRAMCPLTGHQIWTTSGWIWPGY